MVNSGHIRKEYVVFLILSLTVATVRSERNLALFKTATQSSDNGPNRWLADAAVDGCQRTVIQSDCCTHTQGGGPKTVWWRVDLGQTSTIDSIQIIYRADFQQRFAGYQLYMSNTTNSPQDGVLCYQDSSSTRNAVQLNVIHQCPYVGRYVTVYNYRNNPKRYSWYDDYAVLELCEVLVYGCPVGMYGDGDCNQVCPATCYGGNCNPKTGSCLYCIPGRHGSFCEYTCSSTCQGGTCIKDTGTCYGCIAGKYGATCSQDCPLNCDNTGCSQYTGYCHACVTGKHGNTCDLDYPINCKDRICDKNNGHCDDCVDGKYGVTCDMDCSGTCKDPICDRNTGYCSECVAGTYGSSCGQACSVNCKDRVCTKTTGHCIECVTGKFGNICEQDCSVNCKDRLCVKDSGYCTECSLGKYGANCDWDCPGYCRDGCTRDNAIDCYPGKYGVVCGADCPAYCPDNICNKEDGHCLIQVDSNVIIIAVLAVICGLLVAALIAAIICICWLRNKVKENKSPNKTTGQSGLDTGYTSIDRNDVEPTHVYEMVVT